MPIEVYQKRIKHYDKSIKQLSKRLNSISRFRFFVILAMLGTIVFAELDKLSYTYALALPFLVVFAFLVIRHRKLKAKLGYEVILKQINIESVMRLNDKWTEFKDKGEEFIDESHSYSYDLDLFGQGSLFQLINTANTSIGRARLAEMFTKPDLNKTAITKKQNAISELAKKRWWRTKLQAEGKVIKENVNIQHLTGWAQNKNLNYSNTWFIAGSRLLPVITAGTLLLAGVGLLAASIPVGLLTVQFLLLMLNIKNHNSEFTALYKYKNCIKAYQKILRQFEKSSFKSEYLRELSDGLKVKGLSAIEQLKRLERLVNRIENRNNQLFIVVNVVLLWDYQCLIALEKWKNQSGTMLKKWLQAVGEIEALASLANIEYNYPAWAKPEITEKPSTIIAEDIGHPLLKSRVCNDAHISDAVRILLITGSNMSGKSTYLRTIGINLVLAYIGAPVCADYLKCSIFNIQTCMRISDNLNKGLSSFYAELLKIKQIVEATAADPQVFFLLDEIFKGTNSYDRHIGAKRVIKKLHENGAVGLVSTHDLELGLLEEDIIKNYHFQEHYDDNEICFDYKLKSGISSTRNALYLMKIIGIEEE